MEQWLRVLCVDQTLNTERTERLRDLSVEVWEARRSRRESVGLRPTVALMVHIVNEWGAAMAGHGALYQ